MKQSEIKFMTRKLRDYEVPVGRLSVVGEQKFVGKLSNSNETRDILMEQWDKETIGLSETFGILLLDRSMKAKAWLPMFQGGISGTVTDTRLILLAALLSFSTGMILAHNHPSGNTAPSDADLKVTKKIKESAALMDINVVDHIILTPDGDYYSFANEGMI